MRSRRARSSRASRRKPLQPRVRPVLVVADHRRAPPGASPAGSRPPASSPRPPDRAARRARESKRRGQDHVAQEGGLDDQTRERSAVSGERALSRPTPIRRLEADRLLPLTAHRSPLTSSVHLQHGQKRLLRNLHRADLLHPLLPLFLLLEELALAGDVAAVALGQHVLPEGGDRLRAR